VERQDEMTTKPQPLKPRVALYCRVSTNGNGNPDGQTTDTQLFDLRRYCKYKGWQIVEEYVDQGWSRAKTSRPALNRLMEDAKQKKFDICLVWKLDRFGCRVVHVIGAIETFSKLGISFVSFTESFDTTTPMGEAMIGMLTVFANLERRHTSERITARHRLNAARGIFPGPKTRKFTITNVQIERRRKKGESLRQIAASVGCSPMLLSYRLRSQKAH
jgi:DNA invertase Pin-like site-specific DNA recombinase